MLLDDYIKMLKERRAEVGNIRVCMTQQGNYAVGEFADLHENPTVSKLRTNNLYDWVDCKVYNNKEIIEEFLVLGNSDQWC